MKDMSSILQFYKDPRLQMENLCLLGHAASQERCEPVEKQLKRRS